MNAAKLKSFLGELLEKRPDVWFFYGFLITFPFSIRKIITYFPIKGDFNEFTAIFIYLSDLFLVFTIILWVIFILCNNYNILSNYSLYWLKEAILTKKWLKIDINYLILIPLLLVIWSFISIGWSINKPIAIFRSIKFLEFFLLYLYIRLNFTKVFFQKKMFHVEQNTENLSIKNCSTSNNEIEPKLRLIKNSILIFIILGLINALLAFVQIANNGSIGLKFLKESIFNPEMIGVAKITLGDKLFIRPYGFLPHPNILGAYLMVSAILIIFYRHMFHARPVGCSTWNISSGVKQYFLPEKSLASRKKIQGIGLIAKTRRFLLSLGFVKFLKPHFSTVLRQTRRIFHVEHSFWRGTILVYQKFSIRVKYFFRSLFHVEHLLSHAILYNIILLFPLLALLLTFSKNAIIGFLIALLIIYYQLYLGLKNQNSLKLALIKQFFKERVITKRNLLFLAIFVMFLVNLHPSLDSLFLRSLDDRIIFQNVSRGTISENLFTGIGIGQFVPSMDKYSMMPLLKWQFQPVHNVFSLIWSELGLIGLLLFIGFIFVILRSLKHGSDTDSQNIHIKAVFLGLFSTFLFMMLFDHYFWDIQQGMALWWITLALI